MARFLLIFVVFLVKDVWARNPVMSWYITGKVVTQNTTLNFNTGDTFKAQCKGAGGAKLESTQYIDFYLTRSAPATATTLTLPELADGFIPVPTFSAGKLVHSTYNDLEPEFSHWNVALYIFDGAEDYGLVYAQISIPRVSSVDAGTYYCAFNDGSGGRTDALAYAHSVGLTLNILTSSGGSSRYRPMNKLIDYSVALLGAYKVMV